MESSETGSGTTIKSSGTSSETTKKVREQVRRKPRKFGNSWTLVRRKPYKVRRKDCSNYNIICQFSTEI